jgi:NAD(P)H-hydrate epimerase
MLPVTTATEMRRIDREAMELLGLSGRTLMENAGRGAAQVIIERFGPIRGKSVAVLCGKGNNGGDGFVVARYLSEAGANVSAWLLSSSSNVKGDAQLMLRAFRETGGRVEEETEITLVERLLAHPDLLVVDALLGTGLGGPASGFPADVIEVINRSGRPVCSLDLPSGLSSDMGALLGPTVRANLTATFGAWKRGLLLYPGAMHAGEVVLVDIGMPQPFMLERSSVGLLEAGDVAPLFPPRAANSHKGDYGHLLVVAGSVGKSGAAAMAGRSALRSGSGLVTIAAPSSQQPIIAAMQMETMTEPLPETQTGSLALKSKERIIELAIRCDAIALGPGCSLDPETQLLIRELVREVERPMVVDADGLNALVGHLEVLRETRVPRCLTPHPGEMARLLGAAVADVEADRIGVVKSFCERYNVFLVLKGSRSVIGGPDGRVVMNSTGNPGMATGGSGDVLTGMIGSFLARGFEPRLALEAGVFLHGLAGDLAVREIGEEGLIAGDLIEAIPRAIRQVTGRDR